MKVVTMAKPRDPLRRLVLIPDPALEESFHSWTSRISELHECKQIGIAPYLGLTFRIGPYSRGLSRKELEVLEFTTGMPPDRHPAMTLASHGAGHCSYGWTKMNEKSPWFWRPYTSSICPACLDEEESVWKITWQLVPAVACPIHRIFLQGVCPACRLPIPIGTHPDYRRCCNGPYNHVFPAGMGPPDNCHFSLPDLPRRPVHDERVFDLQDRLLARLRRRPTPTDTRFWNAYYLLFRRLLCLGASDMIPNSDFWLMRRWHQFCTWRDQIAVLDADTAEAWLAGLGRAAPGPMLTAAIMLIIEDVWRSRTVAAERALNKGPWNSEAARRDWVTVNRLGIVAPQPATLTRAEGINTERLDWPLVNYALPAIGEGFLDPALEADPSDFDAVRPWTPRRYFRELHDSPDADVFRGFSGLDH